MMADLTGQLRRCFEERVCLMGIGNMDYGDDGLGCALAAGIEERMSHRGVVKGRHEIINARTNPEGFIPKVSEGGFDHVIFIDAVEFGGTPGTVVFLDSREMSGRFPQVSTHKISPALLAGCIEANGITRAWLLGVQPGSVRPGDGLTVDVQRTLDILEERICCLWGEKDEEKTISENPGPLW